MLPPNQKQTQWFLEHVQPHEPMLRAWLRGRFPADFDHDDIVQEAFVRILRAWEAGKIDSPKAFLFATARNLALDRARMNGSHPSAEYVQDLHDETADVPQAVARAQELELLTAAIQSLPARCRRILTLRRFYGMSQKQVAVCLGISEHTVEAQSAIGLRKVSKFFQRVDRRGNGPK